MHSMRFMRRWLPSHVCHGLFSNANYKNDKFRIERRNLIKLYNLALSSCYTCATRCPRDVNFATLAMSLKNKAIRDNLVKDDSKVKFHKSFFQVVDKYGRSYEPELFINIINIKDVKGVLRNAGLGIRLLKKGKMTIRAPKTEQHPWQKNIVEKTNEKAHK